MIVQVDYYCVQFVLLLGFAGFGRSISVHDFSADDLVSNITEMFINPTYSQRIKKASAIFHSEKHPAQRAADAVEHVLKYGADHLRPKEAYKLKWWQFYMLDVFALFYVLALLTLYIGYKLVKCTVKAVIGRCLRKSQSQSQVKAKSD